MTRHCENCQVNTKARRVRFNNKLVCRHCHIDYLILGRWITPRERIKDNEIGVEYLRANGFDVSGLSLVEHLKEA
jgi:hypothetical protein